MMNEHNDKHPFTRQDVSELCRSLNQPAPEGFADQVLAKARDREQVRQQEINRQRDQDRER